MSKTQNTGGLKKQSDCLEKNMPSELLRHLKEMGIRDIPKTETKHTHPEPWKPSFPNEQPPF